jgi:uncharacterized protein YgiM (DUF1202 family)
MKTKQWFMTVLGAALGLVALGGNLQAADGNTNKPARVFQPEPAVTKQDHINVRAQAAINSEVLTRLGKGQVVTVLEEITLKKPKTDEPARWYRIALPTNVSVWVNGTYIEKTNHTVRPNRLNLRGGPGENYSVLGRLEKGATVNVTGEKGVWLKIEAPATAHGFVAAHLLTKEPGAVASMGNKEPVTSVVVVPPVKTNEAPVIVKVPVETNVPTTTITNVEIVPTNVSVVMVTAVETNVTPPPATIITPPTTIVPVVVPPPPTTNVVASNPDNIPANATPPPELVKRIVTREGILKGTFSVLAPSHFELRNLDNNQTMNYVWSPDTNIVLRLYKNKKIMVTGEELLDERWPNMPVIAIEKITVTP